MQKSPKLLLNNLLENLKQERYPVLPEALINIYSENFSTNPQSVLIAEAEKFIPGIINIVEEHNDVHFVLSTQNVAYLNVLSEALSEYRNVETVSGSIYEYEFTDKRFDLIFAAPAFGGRTLATDQTFICREFDTVALENLSYHLNANGRLAIVLPARITFVSGKVADLRAFIQNNYVIKEIAALPEGVFDYTGIKTYYLRIENNRSDDDDITIRKYSAGERKSKRSAITELTIEEDTFILPDELAEQGDWNIDRVFAQQDDEWLKYQASGTHKDFLGNVAQVFRGKAISKKDENGQYGVVTISSIGEYEIDYEHLDHLDEDERKISAYILNEGDVVVPARGTAIRTAIFHEQKYPCVANSNVIVIRPGKELDSTYLKIFLDSPFGNKIIGAAQQGTTVMNISHKDLAAIEVPVPSIEKQKAKAKEYTEALTLYKKIITEAEKHWQNVLNKLQQF